jgi:hypothetical protein
VAEPDGRGPGVEGPDLDLPALQLQVPRHR